ncbi:PRK06851 family protein [Fictibacillus gelatini]|uniref:PRK06851 family protein n=1 Tax=Fictibacillus gelatini TaxID=225985 RepID=UPI000421D22E|nr:PRK06851 family protein [Fictibacillus gelatini]
MAGKIKNYFAGGNTARGFYNLFDSNLQGLERLFILKGGPGTGKSTLMKHIGGEWSGKGFAIEYVHCSSDNESIDGVIIPALKVGIVDGTAPHVIEPKAPGAVEEYVNLGEAWDSEKLMKHKDKIHKCCGEISKSYENAYARFAEALSIHDEWEEIYINNIDFSKLNQLTEKLTDALFGKHKKSKVADRRHRFLGAATPKGAVDFIPNLTEDVKKRYFLKGRPGSGKSTMLKKLAEEAESRGLDVEIYHCGFDPHSLDMVIVRELGFAIFDSTAPHEYFPDRSTDEVIDLYEAAIVPGTDEKFADQLKEISGRYSAKMKEATSWLQNAKALHDELESFYIKAINFSKIDQIRDEINAEIDRMAGIAST